MKKNRVTDPHSFCAYPDPAIQVNADPDPALQVNGNPETAIRVNANPVHQFT